MLGLVTSLIGGIAPRLINANGSVNVIVRGEANARVGYGEARAKPRAISVTAAVRTAGTKKTTEARVIKGEKTMKSINSN